MLAKCLLVLIYVMLLQVTGNCLYSAEDADTAGHIRSEPLISGIGIIGSGTFIYNTAGFGDLPSIGNCCPKFENTVGIGYLAGVVLDKKFNKRLKIGINLTYNYLSTDFAADEEMNVIIEGKSSKGVFRHVLNTEIVFFGFNPFISTGLTSRIWLSGGIILAYLTESRYLQYEKIVEPSDMGTFTDGSRIRNYSKGNMKGINRFLFGFSAGLSCLLNLDKSKTMFLTPFLDYKYYINNYYDNADWDTHIISLGASLYYNFERVLPKVVVPPEVPPLPGYPAPKAPSRLEADIFVIGDSAKPDTRVQIEEFATFGMKPLLNYIFFEKDSFKIPGRYKLLDKASLPAFSDKLTDKTGILDSYYNILNIIASRMKKNSASKLSIIGCNSGSGNEKNNTALSRKRAESVRNYLVQTWDIDSARLNVIARNHPENPSNSEFPMGEDENRRVEIYSSDTSITESILNLDTLSVIKNPEIKFGYFLQADDGVKESNIKISNKSGEILNLKYAGMPTADIYVNLDSLGLNSDKLENLSYNMTITDSGMQVFRTQTKEINIERITVERKQRENLADKKLEYYSIMLFNFAGAELSAEHIKALRYIKSRMMPGATVTITGYSDVIGDEKRNRKISESRAMAVAEALGVPKEKTEGVGEGILLFDNTFPEGRFYCRTVNIKIENPVR